MKILAKILKHVWAELWYYMTCAFGLLVCYAVLTGATDKPAEDSPTAPVPDVHVCDFQFLACLVDNDIKQCECGLRKVVPCEYLAYKAIGYRNLPYAQD